MALTSNNSVLEYEAACRERFLEDGLFYLKFVDFFPLRDKTACGVSKCIRSFIHRWGTPGRILTDQGREFCASVNDELCKAYGIKRSVTSAYHPQTNGLAERTNRTLKTRLAKLCGNKLSDWPNYIEEVAYSIRTQIQKSTGFTPYQLMFGRQHRPIDQEFEVNEELELEVEEAGLAPPEDDVDTSCTFEDYVRLPTTEEVSLFVQKQEQKRQQLHIKRDEKVELAQQKQKAEYNRRKQKGVKSYALEVGMQVLQGNLRNTSRKDGTEVDWSIQDP
ncbi:hypothetical protein Pcinc_014153 [Petrolisthes cinctipes]|uniref:Integrase catalytic domain-containing protein n=1 Tax=Petrolisthes cinctipes TaxID=88211 RepID=A0AAE1KS13_PETCI|nr:hypothetical protein Pcinc_014153 [Petrolisthes cinctipes]